MRKVLRKKLTNLPILYNKMERVITISPKLLIYKIILFSASYILAGCVTASAILFAATNANNNSSDTSKPENSNVKAEKVQLRSSYSNLSVAEVQSIQHITIRKKKEWGFYGQSTIKHDYVLKEINDNKVVIDHATGLMWHQSGSTFGMNWEKAKHWVKLLNKRGYAGYYDWRLPTVEEAASLLESSKNHNNDRFIDPAFDKTQGWILTGDNYYRPNAAWRVDFFSGLVHWDIYYYAFYHVRPVRTIQ